MFDFLFQNKRKPKKTGAEEHSSPSALDLARVAKPFGRLAEAVKGGASERAQSEGDEQRAELEAIKVVSFIGPSGTGKSTRAIAVARDRGIDFFIDDGLLIHGSSVMAGVTAKRADTKIESVRQAIFADETRAANMRRALVENKPKVLMILGTSDDMLGRICTNLWLKQPAENIRIEDITSEEERRQALNTRKTQGKHTIPVPSMEIRHEFSGYLTEPILKLRRKWDRGSKESMIPEAERTVVRPTFSTLGSYSISDEAMGQMVALILKNVPGVAKLFEFRIFNEAYGAIFDLKLSLFYGYNAQYVLSEAQERISEEVQRLSSVNVLRVNLKAVRVEHYEPEPYM